MQCQKCPVFSYIPENSEKEAEEEIEEDVVEEVEGVEDLDVNGYIQNAKEALFQIPEINARIAEMEAQIYQMHYIPRKFLNTLCALLKETVCKLFEFGRKPSANFNTGALRNVVFTYSILNMMLPTLINLSWSPASSKTQKRRGGK